MKKQLFSCVAIAILMLVSCAPGMMPSASLEDSMAIKIECRNENVLKETVLQYLRSARARDIKVDGDDGSLYIQAAFRLQDTPLYKIQVVKEDIQQTSGVIYVNLEENRTVVKQLF